jgi:hypothetical protein
MSHGKDICKELKAVRRSIAEENGIALDIPECTYQGPCRGTCPRCESELRYLENALAERLRMGQAAKVAGIALALASTAAAGAQSTGVATVKGGETPEPVCAGETPAPQNVVPLREPIVGKPAVMSAGLAANPPRVVADSVRVTGTVLDERSKEALPFVNVVARQDGKTVGGATTDFDGIFIIDLPKGRYDFDISSVGYDRYTMNDVRVPQDLPLKPIELKSGTVVMGDIEIIEENLDPLFEYDAGGATQKMEIQGVQVKAQY